VLALAGLALLFIVLGLRSWRRRGQGMT